MKSLRSKTTAIKFDFTNDDRLLIVYELSAEELKNSGGTANWKEKIPGRIKEIKDAITTEKVRKQNPVQREKGDSYNFFIDEKKLFIEYVQDNFSSILNSNITFDGKSAIKKSEDIFQRPDGHWQEVEESLFNLEIIEKYLVKFTDIQSGDLFYLIVDQVLELLVPAKSIFSEASKINFISPQTKETLYTGHVENKFKYYIGKNDCTVTWQTTKGRIKFCEVTMNVYSIIIKNLKVAEEKYGTDTSQVEYCLENLKPKAKLVKIDNKTQQQPTAKLPLILKFKTIFVLDKVNCSLEIEQLKMAAYTEELTFSLNTKIMRPEQSKQSLKTREPVISVLDDLKQKEKIEQQTPKKKMSKINKTKKAVWAFTRNTSQLKEMADRLSVKQKELNDLDEKNSFKKLNNHEISFNFSNGEIFSGVQLVQKVYRNTDLKKIDEQILDFVLSHIPKEKIIELNETKNNIAEKIPSIEYPYDYDESTCKEAESKVSFIMNGGSDSMQKFIFDELRATITLGLAKNPQDISEVSESQKVEFSDNEEFYDYEIIWENVKGRILCELKATFAVVNVRGKEYVLLDTTENGITKQVLTLLSPKNHPTSFYPIFSCQVKFELKKTFSLVYPEVIFLKECCYSHELKNSVDFSKQKHLFDVKRPNDLLNENPSKLLNPYVTYTDSNGGYRVNYPFSGKDNNLKFSKFFSGKNPHLDKRFDDSLDIFVEKRSAEKKKLNKRIGGAIRDIFNDDEEDKESKENELNEKKEESSYTYK